MTPDTTPPNHFHRSTYCGAGGCVEVAARPAGDVLVRDAKNAEPDAPVLRFTKDEWDAFLAGVLAGEFDHTALMNRS